MKKIKASLILVLCLVMAISTCLVSCGEEKPEETKAQNGNTSSDDVEYYIPDKKYDNETITILCPTSDGEWSCNDFYEETSSDEPIPNAVFERKTKVEETFGVKIEVVPDVTRAQTETLVRKTHDAGIIEYDIIVTPIPLAYKLAQGNYIMNLNDMGEYMDFKHDAWDQSFLSQTSIGGENYFATGEITTVDNDGTWIMMFNKEVATANDITPASIYKTVLDGKWTFDKLYQYTSSFYSDSDADGEISHLDTFGIVSTTDFIQGLYYGANGHIITKDNEDLPYLDFNNDRNSSIIDWIIKLYYKSNKITLDNKDYLNISFAIAQNAFEQGRALFYSEVMQCAIRLREMETDFGIIPMPKYNQDQEHYTTHVVALTAFTTCFPKLLEADEKEAHRDMVAMVAQALAVEGKNILTPAYYEKSLMYKGARDDESRAMLPIIFANRVCDLGYMAEGTVLSEMYGGMIDMIKKDGQNQIASLNKKNETRMAKAIQRMIEAFQD